MIKPLSIKFVRHIRECDYNKNLKDGEHPIYDFDILIDGVRRATFKKNIGRGYDLALQFPEWFEHVKTPKRDGSHLQRVIEAPSKAKFLETVQDCLIKGLIPKPKEIERRIAAKKETAAKIAAEAVAEQKAGSKRQWFEEHGSELLQLALHADSFIEKCIECKCDTASHGGHECGRCQWLREFGELKKTAVA